MKIYTLLLVAILFIMACNNDDDAPIVYVCPSDEINTHILLGNPSDATNNENNPNINNDDIFKAIMTQIHQ